MAVNPIDASLALDLKFREAPGGTARQRRSVPPAAAAGGESATEQQQQVAADNQEAQQQEPPSPQAAAVALNMNLKFSTDEQTGKLVVSVINPSNGEILRQMPSEEALKVAEQIGKFQGMFVDLKV